MYFFLKLIYRFNFEVGLVKFVELIFIVKFLDIEVVIYINFDIQFEFINFKNKREMCKNVKEMNNMSNIFFRFVFVNDLFICLLVILKNDEFVVEFWDRIKLFLLNVVFFFQYFCIFENGSY